MRIIRYRPDPSSQTKWGWVSEDKVGSLKGSPFEEYRRQRTTSPLSEVQLLAPLQPSKIVCVGRNYAAHAAEHDAEVPALPIIFLKPPSSVIGPGDPIVLPPQSSNVEYEAELGVVMSQATRWISPREAADHILGYTVGLYITARDLQHSDDQWTRSKGFDTFCPIGPWIETELDPADAMITCTVNGQLRQMASTRDMVFSVPELIAFISSVMTLQPGDLILTGTPAGVGPLLPGDEVTAEIEGVGSLTNPVQAHER